MEKTELRIGNLVLFHDRVETAYSVQSSGLHFYRGKSKRGVITQSYVWEAIQGIPLTEEWLLKFGFEVTYQSSFRKKYDSETDFIGYDFNLTTDNSMQGFRLYGRWLDGINFVHQLQNLYFALTGEELTLKQ